MSTKNEEDDFNVQIKKIDKSIAIYFCMDLFVGLLFFGSMLMLSVFYCNLVSETLIAMAIAGLFLIGLLWAFLDTEQDRLRKIKKSLLANHKNILPVLNEYCCVEKFSAENSVSKVLQQHGFFGDLIKVGNGCNYLKFTIDDIFVETSQMSLSVRYSRSPRSFFSGQIAILTTQESFPGRLLIIRTKMYGITDYGFSCNYSFEQQGIIENMFMPDKKRVWKWWKMLKNTIIPVTTNFDQTWHVYSTNPEAAKQFVGEDTKLHNYLLYTSRMAFILYDNNSIVFGGKYGFSLTDSTSSDISEEDKLAIYAFFKEAIPAVTKNALQFSSFE